MTWITESKLFKASKNQEKILAAFQNPINKPLVQQLTSYVDVEYAQKLQEELEAEQNEQEVAEVDTENTSNDSKKSSGTHNSKASSPAKFSPSSRNSNLDSENSPSESEELSENSPSESEEPTENSSEVEESTHLSSSPILSSSYVTVEAVSLAANEIPGMLNLREDTQGATYAKMVSGQSNELWIYYDESVDLNKILDKVNLAIVEGGYYFLEFTRVSRDDNAIVFTINWVSNYFNPIQLKDLTNER